MTPEIFPIPDRTFEGGPDFRAYLAEAYGREAVEPLTIMLGVTKHSEGELVAALEGFGLHVARRLGNVFHLATQANDEQLETYMTFEATAGVIIFYTNFRKTEDVPLITKFLQQDRMSHPLFLRPVVMQRVLDQLSGEFHDIQITEFTARRYPGSRTPAQVRPSVPRRTIQYWGADGLHALDEMRYQYGVTPTRLVIEIPEAVKFGIDGRGWLTYHRGDLSLVLRTLGEAINEAQKASRAFDGSSFQVFPLKTKHKTFQIPTSTPVVIQLRRQLTFAEMDEVKGALNNEFVVLDFTAQEGSLFLSTDLVAQSGHRFRVKADEAHIKMLPSGEPNFAAFMDFYEFVVNSIDPEAELVVA